MTYEKVLKAALALTPQEQNELVGRVYGHLQETDEAPLSPEWLAEIQRRSDEIDRGTVKMISYETMKRRMRRLRESVKAKR